MDLELRYALRALAAAINSAAAVGMLPAGLVEPSAQVMDACDIPPNETPKRVSDVG